MQEISFSAKPQYQDKREGTLRWFAQQDLNSMRLLERGKPLSDSNASDDLNWILWPCERACLDQDHDNATEYDSESLRSARNL